MAKPASLDQFGEILIRGGDYSHVDFGPVLSSNASDFMFLQYAEELGLHVWTDVADFIQKAGAGERAAHMPE